ncbi:uncharacterized protein [Dermacentor albipictus]|uniref:uncharacterized protein n=1 Tax=Dermacentor albipictus TaxID=60249 RepID=UPI0038FD35DC
MALQMLRVKASSGNVSLLMMLPILVGMVRSVIKLSASLDAACSQLVPLGVFFGLPHAALGALKSPSTTKWSLVPESQYPSICKEYEHGIGGIDGSKECKLKFSELKPLAVINGTGFNSKENDHVYGSGAFYSFAIRAIKESYFGESFQAIVEEEAVNYAAFPWSGVHHWETMVDGKMVHLSKHIGDEEGTTKFPTSTGLDPFLTHFVLMEVGTVAHYTGVYSGKSEVTVMAVGKRLDMGRPSHSGVTIRISIRMTLDAYIFFPDYGSEPVVAEYDNLVSTGDQYAPRFSKNFSVRQVHMEVFY